VILLLFSQGKEISFLQQHYSSQKAVPQHNVSLYVHKKRLCFNVSQSTSAVTAMKMFQELFCICDNCKNGVRCLLYVALKEYLFLIYLCNDAEHLTDNHLLKCEKKFGSETYD